MVRDEEKYAQAVQFRKRGFTLAEIAKICDVSKSTVSKWLKNKAFSASVTKQNKHRAGQANAKRLKLVNKARSGERQKRYQEAERSAKTEYQHYKNDPQFVAGLITYQAAGDQSDASAIRLSSTDQTLHALFVRFATAYLGVERRSVRFWLLLYPGHVEERCVRSWSRALRLPVAQCGKSQFIKQKPKRKPLHNGVGNTIIGSTVLKRKLTVWLKLAQKDLTKT